MFKYNLIKRGGGGVQGQISWKHDFDITGDPKVPPSGSTFWWGFEAPDSIIIRNPHWTESPLDGIPTGRNPHQNFM